ncbi:galactoside O-acetyltransferase [Clostridium sp. SHJSY1]|uniref:maltose acetyltransferase domain-containing protein n=1 Tax=Clostridium sp. SHJSY1 TaxID=2942483 RepID=UPI0028761E37|nr:maltose acetyltransferase domain-containing protein [Clostridium sp. SHJSY1]MDS0525804.1 galactoside O-acetyltransferase [Clostridium sp. SHJSY1]
MSQRENIANGKLFTDMCEGLPEERLNAKELVYEFNHTRPSDIEKRIKLMNEMFGLLGENCWVEPPINLCYGTNVFIGDNFYANYNLSLIDDYKITIGNNVLIAPNVTIAVTGHPVHPELRQHGEMYAFPVTIEDYVWIGSGVIICPGVTIGKNSVIGAGSVVTKDIPANSIAVGNPCKVIREINDNDKIYYYKNLKVE